MPILVQAPARECRPDAGRPGGQRIKKAAHRAAHFISSVWFEILPVIHLTMAKSDLGHPVLEKAPFYEARLIRIIRIFG